MLAVQGIIGIDLGTSSAKVLILDTQGRTLGTGRADYAVMTPQSGWIESDPAEWWQAVVSAVRAALASLPQAEIIAIGLAGQMHGVALADGQGRALRPALLWPDSRAGEELERYRALPADALRRLANPLAPGMAGPLLCWLARHEEGTYQEACWALQPKDWLRMCLTGIATTDPSDASATLLYDLPSDDWAYDIMAALGLRRELFPPILPSGVPAGPLTAQAAAALGLPPGLPVATGAADTAAAALGSGLLLPGPVQLTLGTGAQLIQLCSEPAGDPALRTHLYRASDGEHWYRMAAVQNAGLALDWVRRTLGATWDELYASADMLSPGTDGLLFLPYLTPERFMRENDDGNHNQGEREGRPYPTREGQAFVYGRGDPRARPGGGAFIGLRVDHRREHLLRAALEGVAFGIRAALEMLPGAGAVSTRHPLRLAGGGSVHPSWRQMLADVLGCELLIVDVPDASARGAALLGGIAGGVWIDVAATASIAPAVSEIVRPDAGRVRVYDEAYEMWVRR